jgi:hypothetical protein
LTGVGLIGHIIHIPDVQNPERKIDDPMLDEEASGGASIAEAWIQQDLTRTPLERRLFYFEETFRQKMEVPRMPKVLHRRTSILLSASAPTLRQYRRFMS